MSKQPGGPAGVEWRKKPPAIRFASRRPRHRVGAYAPEATDFIGAWRKFQSLRERQSVSDGSSPKAS
jgi:hypothetical protein